MKYRWSYLDFRDYLDDLKLFFNENGIGDDPFCSYYLNFLELEVDPKQSQVLEVIRNQDDCEDISYHVISAKDKNESEFERDGKWYWSDTYKIRIS